MARKMVWKINHISNSKKSGAGFTLIELLVVISITGILSSIILVNLSTARGKARVARAQTEIQQIAKAIIFLEIDTEYWPGHQTRNSIPTGGEAADNEICAVSDGCSFGLNDEESGLTQDDLGNLYSGWKGPYYHLVPLDPWGHEYFFDTDYDINPTPGDQNVYRAVIGSYGPDGKQNNGYQNVNPNYAADDIIYILPAQ